MESKLYGVLLLPNHTWRVWRACVLACGACGVFLLISEHVPFPPCVCGRVSPGGALSLRSVPPPPLVPPPSSFDTTYPNFDRSPHARVVVTMAIRIRLQRGARADYDHWAVTAPSWSWDHVAPYFESNLDYRPNAHGHLYDDFAIRLARFSLLASTNAVPAVPLFYSIIGLHSGTARCWMIRADWRTVTVL